MDHLAQRNESNYYSHSQSNLSNNRSSINIPPTTGYLQQQQSSSVPNMTSRTSRLSRPTEEWKKSSSSIDSGWKTTSNNNKQMESWKMSGKPRHAQLSTIQHDDVHTRRQSAPIFNSPAWHPKPLPIEPTPIIQHDYNVVYPPVMEDYTQQAPFHLTTPMQQPAFIRPPQQDFYPQNYNNSPPTQQYPPTQYPPTQYPPTQPQAEYPPAQYPPDLVTQPYPPVTQPTGYNYNYPPSSSSSFHEYPPIDHGVYHPEPPITQAVSLQDPPKTPEKATKKKDPNAKPEKKVRQITVQSINAEHRVWIDVLPAETGLSLAEKIHIIATFRTRKIVSIQTKSGRKVPLDNRPVFGSWMDMENFEDGERWTVEWRENDRGVMDKFMSKIVQAGGGKRKDHVAKE